MKSVSRRRRLTVGASRRCPRRGRGARGSSAVELVILAPALVGLALLVLWAGRVGRTAMLADLAAEEAATAAAVVCRAAPDCSDPSVAAEMEAVADAVVSSREWGHAFCAGGVRPDASAFVASSASFATPPEAVGVRWVEVGLRCDTDGGVVPLRGVLGTVRVRGHGLAVIRSVR